MKVAFSVLNGRISPVYDSSCHALVIDDEGGASHETLLPEAPLTTARHLAAAGVRVLVCGAISADVAALLAGQGIRVVPFVAGDVGEVIAARASGLLPNECLLMPGCSLQHAQAFARDSARWPDTVRRPIRARRAR